jgi:hypothetical protein
MLQISHKAALYVVLPIGSTTTISNYVLHKNKPLAALSSVGLALIFGSNAHIEGLPGILHETRWFNTLGCGMLLGSSYLSHKLDPHDHDHHGHKQGHGHGHGGEGDGQGEGAGKRCCATSRRGTESGAAANEGHQKQG